MNPPVVSARVLLGEWTRLLVRTLVSANVRDYVICPGSRNAPLVFELARTLGASGEGSIAIHSVIDERAAGFFALGIARATGRIPAVICTSGSAGAHLLPAVVEAHEAGLSLLLITADRPLALQDCGAPQTIAQAGLFGRFATAAPDLGDPDEQPDKLRALVRKVRQAVHAAHSPKAGAVHLNVPLAKPLEPEEPSAPAELALRGMCDSLLGHAPLVTSSRVVPMASALNELQAALADGATTLFTLGPVSSAVAARVFSLGRAHQIPVATDLPSEGGGGEIPYLAQATKRLLCARIVHFGPPCIASSWQNHLETFEGTLWTLPGERFLEPTGRAHRVITGNLEESLDALLQMSDAASAHHPSSSERATHLLTFQAFREVLRAQIHEQLSAAGAAPFAEVNAVGAALAAAHSARQILVGNSLPLRLASFVAPTLPAPIAPITTARGANGIDGFIAAAAGATSGTSSPTLALLGDVTAAHDIGSLWLAKRVKSPLALVVLDNAGGRIFDHLPFRAAASEVVTELVRTPPGVNWQAAAQAFGVEFAFVSSRDEMSAAVSHALSTPVATLIHAKVDSESTFAFLAQVRAGVDAWAQGGK